MTEHQEPSLPATVIAVVLLVFTVALAWAGVLWFATFLIGRCG